MTRFRAGILLLSLAFSSAALAELAIYDVDDRYRQEVFAALRGVLSSERAGSASGSVELLPTGQILIDTTPERHAEIAAVIEAISDYRAEPAPRVTLRYWAVLGSREMTGDADTPEILSDVLDEIRRVHDNLEFRVVGNATLVTESGQAGRLDGEPLGIRHQQAYVQGTTLNTELQIVFQYRVLTGQFTSPQQDGQVQNPFQTIQMENQFVQLTTSIERDEFVVVGENAIRATNGQEELEGTIFYIVHWPAAD